MLHSLRLVRTLTFLYSHICLSVDYATGKINSCLGNITYYYDFCATGTHTAPFFSNSPSHQSLTINRSPRIPGWSESLPSRPQILIVVVDLLLSLTSIQVLNNRPQRRSSFSHLTAPPLLISSFSTTNSVDLLPCPLLPLIHTIKRVQRLLSLQHTPLATRLRQRLIQALLLGELLAVIEEELLADVDVPESEEFDAVLAINEDDLRFAVETVGSSAAVVDEPGFIPKAGGVNDALCVEVEQEGEEFAVVDYTSSVGLFRGDVLKGSFSTSSSGVS